MHILAISQSRDIETSKWKAVINSGIDALMIREKRLDTASLMDLAKRIRDMAPNLTLWVNGRLDVALAIGAGFHGGDDCPTVSPSHCAVSRSLHDIAQLAERNLSDQLLISPVYSVPGKGESLGVTGLHSILDKIPDWSGKLLALGGITHENVHELWHSRLDGVALIRCLWNSDKPAGVVEKMRGAWKEK